jgi:hypothetical protein
MPNPTLVLVEMHQALDAAVEQAPPIDPCHTPHTKRQHGRGQQAPASRELLPLDFSTSNGHCSTHQGSAAHAAAAKQQRWQQLVGCKRDNGTKSECITTLIHLNTTQLPVHSLLVQSCCTTLLPPPQPNTHSSAQARPL